jgi:hypothetical protein
VGKSSIAASLLLGIKLTANKKSPTGNGPCRAAELENELTHRDEALPMRLPMEAVPVMN